MKDSSNNSDNSTTLFQASHMMILVTMTVASIALGLEGILLNWEKWPMIPIFAAVAVSWTLHIHQTFNDRYRTVIHCTVLMGLLFYYGIHPTSTFDLSVTACIGIVLCTTTGVKKLIYFCVITFCISFGYNVVLILSETPELFDALMLSRIIYHPLIVFVVGWLGSVLIDLWTQLLDHSKHEVEQLTEATGRFNEFLTKVSHEIRTPVNAVLGLSSIAIEQAEDKDQLQNLREIQLAGKRVAEQISDILDYSEVDRQRFAMNIEDYMLASVLHDLVMEIKPYMKKGVEFIIDVDPSTPAMLRSDVAKLKKIIWHLTTNALKFTQEGGVYLRITSQPQDYGINLVFDITDTGEGMSDEESERIFDGYYQASNTYTRQAGGLGLGMSIVNGYVSALGGFLCVSSVKGEGTTVRVTIPQEVVDPSGCISVRDPGRLVIGAFLNFEKHFIPVVRDFYNRMVVNIVKGLNVQMHRVDSLENLIRLNSSIRMTHLFVGEDEYAQNIVAIEKLAENSNITVSVVASDRLVLPAGTRVHLMEKPFYCFPVAEVLNRVNTEEVTDKYMYCHGIRALVVDDEPLNLTVAKDILGRYDMSVTTVSSGQEAIDICSKEAFDIVFMDHMMPGMDGIEAMRRIRSDVLGAWKSVPMVALTANAVSTARESFRIAGFDGFVAKPIDILELERVLRLVLPKTVVTFEDTPHSRKRNTNMRRRATDRVDDSAAAAREIDGAVKFGRRSTDRIVGALKAPATDPGALKTPAADPGAPLGTERSEDVFTPLRKLGVDVTQGLLYCQKDEEFYRSLLVQFASEAAEKRTNLEKFFTEKNLNDYSIIVHALKSTSKMIGASDLSAKAKALEEASKSGDFATVENGHKTVITEYTVLTDTILENYGEDDPGEDEAPDKTTETATQDRDALEFGPVDDEPLEFGPVNDDVLEFRPESEGRR